MDALAYNSRLRKRLRALLRILRYQLTPGLYPKCYAPRAWWWHQDPNFGDLLTPLVLPKYGIAPILKPVSTIDVIGVGSIVSALPADYAGVIWGTGSFGTEEALPKDARVLALRGRDSWEKYGKPDVQALGDPGLLVSQVVRAPARPKFRLGLVAHFTHRQLPIIRELLRNNPDIQEIDVSGPPRRVIKQIASCQAVVTTSLHGLITADSYGIPAAWALPEPVITGGEFKFLDHESVVRPPVPRRLILQPMMKTDELLAATHPADPMSVNEAITGLEQSTAALKQHCGEPVRPLQLWLKQLRS